MSQSLAYAGRGPAAAPVSGVGRRFLRRVARGAVLALALQVAGAGLAYLSQVALARWMGTSQFGAYAYLIAWVTVLALICGLGFPISVLRFIPEYRALGERSRLRGLVRMSRAATLLAGAAVAAVGVGAVAAVGGSVSLAVAIAALLVPLGALVNLDVSILRAGGRVAGAYAPSLVLRPAVVLLGAAALWLGLKGRLTATQGIAVTVCAFLAVAAVQAWLLRPLGRGSEHEQGRAYELRRWLSVSAPLLLVAGFQIALSQTDLLVVGAVRGARYAAFYQAASKTSLLVGYLLVASSAVTAPLFAELHAKGDRAGLARLAAVSAQWTFWPTLALAVGLALLGRFVLSLFGPDFTVARWALTILLAGQLVNAGCGAVGYLLSMTGHERDTARVYGISSLFNVALCYAGVRAFGIEGAAAASTVSLIGWNLWLHSLTVKRLGVGASIVSSARARRSTSPARAPMDRQGVCPEQTWS